MSMHDRDTENSMESPYDATSMAFFVKFIAFSHDGNFN